MPLSQVTHIPVAAHTNNIGDDIQSYAASLMYRCSQWVDRDHPELWPADALVPLVGWYGYGKFPSPAQCQVVGLHVEQHSRAHFAETKVVDWLKTGIRRQGFPGLARDLVTRDFLRSLGLETEFGGCVTQTLPRDDGPRAGTLIVDVPGLNIQGWQDTHLRDHLTVLTADQRIEEARVQILRFARSATVHTSRLHALLPCHALGTEVVFHWRDDLFQVERFSGHVDRAQATSD